MQSENVRICSVETGSARRGPEDRPSEAFQLSSRMTENRGSRRPHGCFGNTARQDGIQKEAYAEKATGVRVLTHATSNTSDDTI